MNNKLVYASIVKETLESKGFDVNIIENSRNNGASVGISVRNEDNVSPIFYIQDDMDEDPFEFANKILSFKPEYIDLDKISDVMSSRTSFLDRVHYILVNSSLNAKRDSIVRVPINSSLELHYKLDISDVFADAKISIEKKHIESLGISLAELAHRAYHNTMEKFKPKIYSLSDCLPEVSEIDYLFGEFMVLSNESNVYGAGAILYEGMYERLQEVMDGDFLVIPSSVHEVLLVGTEYGDVNALTSIINEVNSNVVSPQEVLSDRPYKLIRDKKLVEA